ncbi:PhoH family protein, partial [bacterium]|nr:PhoH family protein [bacterium]
MIKNFVLDTNVLIHDTDCIHSFADNKVTIPIAVIEELDKLKRSPDERGRNARLIAHKIDDLRVKGKLNEGVPLEEGGVFKVELDPSKKDLYFKSKNSSPDTRILHTAMALQEKGENVVFITKDINLRIRAEAVGLTVQNYEKEKVNIETLYSGYRTIKVGKEVIDRFFKDKKIKADKLGKFSPNEFIILKDGQNDSHSALLKYDQKSDFFIPLSHQKTVPWGIKPLNKEQRFALELLLSEEIKLVTLVGVAGSGKTLLSIACG